MFTNFQQLISSQSHFFKVKRIMKIEICIRSNGLFLCFRYICILHNEHYHKLFGVKGTVISFIILWICVIAMDLPNWPILGLGGSHAYADFGMHCSFAATTNVFYNTIMYTGWAVVFPAAVILFCYLNILIRTSSQFFMAKIQRFEEKIVQDRTFEPNSNCFRCVKTKQLEFLSNCEANKPIKSKIGANFEIMKCNGCRFYTRFMQILKILALINAETVILVAAHLRSLRTDDPLSKGYPRFIN